MSGQPPTVLKKDPREIVWPLYISIWTNGFEFPTLYIESGSQTVFACPHGPVRDFMSWNGHIILLFKKFVFYLEFFWNFLKPIAKVVFNFMLELIIVKLFLMFINYSFSGKNQDYLSSRRRKKTILNRSQNG